MVADTKLAVGAQDKDGKEICRAFRNTGSCRFGTDCKYAHTSGKQRVSMCLRRITSCCPRAGPQIETPPRDYTVGAAAACALRLFMV